jgi:hypothetical protein
MEKLIQEQYLIYIDRILKSALKQKWVEKNLPLFYEWIKDKEGDRLSEKVYLLSNKKSECKICNGEVEFLSYKRGYRDYCSKKCSNNDTQLLEQKVMNCKKNNLMKWGVEFPSQLESVKEKARESEKNRDYASITENFRKSCMEKWGVDNPSKLEEIKMKKIQTTQKNYGVENPFQSEEIKIKSKKSLFDRYGVDTPLKSQEIKDKSKKTTIENWGVDNFTKSKQYRELMFEKYRSKSIKTNLNSDINYHSYLGLGQHLMKCDCNLEHLYETNSHLYHARKRIKSQFCTICNPVGDTSSVKEIEVLEFIKSNYKGEVIHLFRQGLEIDIYLPDLNLGFEFNGLYWHSEIFKDRNYHLGKTEHFEKLGIRIIHIWEDDWLYRNSIIKSQIKNWLGFSDLKIGARRCQVKEIIDKAEYRKFLDENHIQGYVPSTLKLGLYYKNELVSLMTFDHFEGRKKMNLDEWNLSRFCNKINTNVLGGASKLLKYFILNYDPSRIISFSDKSWSVGNLYFKLGFLIKNITRPNYYYIVDGIRSNKQKWKKSNLVKLGFDKKLSESQIMEDNFGAVKIFDCGQIKFEYKPK